MHPANPTMSRSSVDENGETSQSEGDSSTMTIDDPLVDLMAQWEEYHHQGEQPPSDWPGDVDPGIGEASVIGSRISGNSTRCSSSMRCRAGWRTAG